MQRHDGIRATSRLLRVELQAQAREDSRRFGLLPVPQRVSTMVLPTQ